MDKIIVGTLLAGWGLARLDLLGENHLDLSNDVDIYRDVNVNNFGVFTVVDYWVDPSTTLPCYHETKYYIRPVYILQ